MSAADDLAVLGGRLQTVCDTLSALNQPVDMAADDVISALVACAREALSGCIDLLDADILDRGASLFDAVAVSQSGVNALQQALQLHVLDSRQRRLLTVVE